MRSFVLVLLLALFGLALFCPTHLNAEENHAGELGYCSLCNTRIMDRIDFHIRPNEEYNELWFEFSNDTVGKIAFCGKHYKQLMSERYENKIPKVMSNRIMEGIKRGWNYEFILNNWTEKQVNKYIEDYFGIVILRRLKDEEIPVN